MTFLPQTVHYDNLLRRYITTPGMALDVINNAHDSSRIFPMQTLDTPAVCSAMDRAGKQTIPRPLQIANASAAVCKSPLYRSQQVQHNVTNAQ